MSHGRSSQHPTDDDLDDELDSDQDAALIEAGGTDEEGEFTPSDYDDESMADSSSSLGSSIYEHLYQNGRRYHRFRYIHHRPPNAKRLTYLGLTALLLRAHCVKHYHDAFS